MLLRVLTLTLALTGAAVVQEAPEGLAEKVAEIAAGCWSLLPSEKTADHAVNLEVTLAEGGEVVGRPAVLDRRDSLKYGGARRSAQNALVSCGPYPEAGEFTGPLKVTMTPKVD